MAVNINFVFRDRAGHERTKKIKQSSRDSATALQLTTGGQRIRLLVEDDTDGESADTSRKPPFKHHRGRKFGKASSSVKDNQIPQAGKSSQSSSLTVYDPGQSSDPFGSYPIPFTGCVPEATDYFLHYYGPTSFIRPELSAGNPGLVTEVVDGYFRLALQEPLLFRGMITLSLAVKTAGEGKPTKEVLYHHGKALIQLQESLMSTTQCATDAVIFTILAMLAVDYLFNNLVAFETHLKGLRSIVAIRGGLDKLDWPLLMKPSIVTLESMWAYNAGDKAAPPLEQPDEKSLLEADSSDSEMLDYPSHPFPAYLCAVIAKVPSGLRELALKCTLSFALMQLLKGVADWVEEMNLTTRKTSKIWDLVSGVNTRIVERCKRLLVNTDLKDVERLVCSGVMAFVINMGKSERYGSQYLVYTEQLVIEADKLVKMEFRRSEEVECLFWVAIVIAAPGDTESIINPSSNGRTRLLDSVLDRYERSRDWRLLRKDAIEFFWDEASEVRWRASWEDAMNRRDDVTKQQQ